MKSRLLPFTTVFVALALFAALTIGMVQPAAAQTEPTDPTPTPLPDPLEYPLPSDSTPVSSWRPPLYHTPWALTSHDHFYFSRPVAVDEVNWPLPTYRYGGIFFAPDAPHTGVDIVVDTGTPVLAAGPGQVIFAGSGLVYGTEENQNPYGLAVVIRHDFGWNNQPIFTVYAHMSDVIAQKGQHVETGDVIGLSGETGFTTAPHLHFEVRIGTNTYYDSQNPELWLVSPVGWGVVAGKLTDGPSLQLFSQDIILVNQETNQKWVGQTYGSVFTVNRDPYYKENFVISDLPAGEYLVQIPYYGMYYETTIEVRPGAVTYIRFMGWMGFVEPEFPTPVLTNLPTLE